VSKLRVTIKQLDAARARLRAEFSDIQPDALEKMASILARSEGLPRGAPLREPRVPRGKGTHRMDPCGGCSATKGRPEPGASLSLYTCGGCGGLVGKCLLVDFHKIVKPRWCKEPNVPQERWRYYDVDALDAATNKEDRHHGWYDRETGCILQTG